MRIIKRNLNKLLLVAILSMSLGPIIERSRLPVPGTAGIGTATSNLSLIPGTESRVDDMPVLKSKNLEANATVLTVVGLLNYRICYLVILFLGFLVMIQLKMKKDINIPNFSKNDISS